MTSTGKRKVILISPNYNSQQVAPPLGLGYLAGSLLAAGHEVEIIDCLRDGIRNENIGSILSGKNPDIVGVTAVTPSYPLVVELCRTVRGCCPDAKIVVGGPHPTALPETTLKETGADGVIIGEGERSIVELAGSSLDGDWKNIKGIVYLDSQKKVVQTGRREPVSNIDELPWPAWHLLGPNKYPRAPHGNLPKNFPVAPILTSRGCPYDCSFCAVNCLWQHKFRMRDPKNVVDEIEYLVKDFGIREIHIEDDNFTLVKEHAMKVCQGIMDRKLDISWNCPNGVRADRLDEELLKLMKQSGCYLLSFGIESGSEKILEMHSKAINKEKIRAAVGLCNEIGIETQGFFIIGLPGENRETVEETIRFSKELRLDRAQFSIFTPFPGSKLWDELKDEIKAGNMGRFKQFDVVQSFSDLSESDMEAAKVRAFREFYLRPRIILNLLRYVRPSQLRFLLERARMHFL